VDLYIILFEFEFLNFNNVKVFKNNFSIHSNLMHKTYFLIG
jgi:hypothetical protein